MLEQLEKLSQICMSFCIHSNNYRTVYEPEGIKWELSVYWDNPVGFSSFEGGEGIADLVSQALSSPDRLQYKAVRDREAAFNAK